MNLSDKLIELRKGKGWSQEDFAEKLDVSRQAISRWENGTALPDAQNILRISKLFNVTADYLLNDDYEGEPDNPVAQSSTEETTCSVRKKIKMFWYIIPAICLITAAVSFIIGAAVGANAPTSEVHAHPVLNRAIENEVAPTCTVEGSYDEVLYCAECGEEVLRVHIINGIPAHQFENQKCIVCGEDQREKD